MRLNFKKIGPLLILASLAFIFYSYLFLPQLKIIVTPDFGSSDIWHGHMPLKYFLAQSLKNFSLPLWSQNLGTGYPLLAQGHLGTFNLLNLIIYFLFSFPLATNLFFLFNSFICLLGGYFLAKELKFKSIVALFFSFTFAFSGFFVGHMVHLDLFQPTCLIPLIMLCFIKALKNKKYWPFFSLILAQQILSGSGGQQIVFITLIQLFFILIFLSSRQKKPDWHFFSRRFFYWTIFLLLAVLTAAIQLLPTKTFFLQSARSRGLDFELTTAYPYPLKHLLTFLDPYLLGHPGLGTYPVFNDNWGIFWENTGYIGKVPLFLLAIAWFNKRRKKLVKFSFYLTLISLLFVLGKNSPLYFIFTFPPFNLFRVPSRFLLITIFSLCLLASCGLEQLILILRQKGSSTFRHLLVTAIIVTAFLDLFFFAKNYHPRDLAQKWFTPPPLITYLQQNTNQGRILSLGFEHFWAQHFPQNGWADMNPYFHLRNNPINYANLFYSLPQFKIDSALPQKRESIISQFIRENFFWDDTNKNFFLSPAGEKFLDLESIKYLILPYPLIQTDLQLILPSQADNKFFTYQNPNFGPQIRAATDFKLIKSYQDFVTALSQEDFDFNQTVLLEEEVNLSQNPSGLKPMAINLKNFDQQHIQIEVNNPQANLLVISTLNYPGWQAYIDQQKTKILSANINQMALVVPEGQHQISLKYQPQELKYGALISLLSLTFLGGLILKNFILTQTRH